MFPCTFSALKSTRPKAVKTADADLALCVTGLKHGVNQIASPYFCHLTKLMTAEFLA